MGAAGSEYGSRLFVALLCLLPAWGFHVPIRGSFPWNSPTQQGGRRSGHVSMVSTMRGRSRVNYYEILGITPDASRDAIKRAYHQKAKTLHPDLSRTTNTTREFLMVKEAYETLHTLEKRLEFDRKKAVGEVAELALNVGEILATDLAIPLARDVALPLIKATFNHLDQTVFKGLRPLASSMYESIKQEAGRRVALQRAEEARKALEHRQYLKNMLVEASEKANRAKEATVEAYTSMRAYAQAEKEHREKLAAQDMVNEQLSLEFKEISKKMQKAKSIYEEAAIKETTARMEFNVLFEQASKASQRMETAEALVAAAQTELHDAEEALKAAQLRVSVAKEDFTCALSTLADSKLKKSIRDAKLEAGSLVLAAAKLALKVHRHELDSVASREAELKELSTRHNEVQREIQREMSACSEGRLLAQMDLERAEKASKELRDKVASLTEKLQKAERKSAARDFVTSVFASEEEQQQQQQPQAVPVTVMSHDDETRRSSYYEGHRDMGMPHLEPALNMKSVPSSSLWTM